MDGGGHPGSKETIIRILAVPTNLRNPDVASEKMSRREKKGARSNPNAGKDETPVEDMGALGTGKIPAFEVSPPALALAYAAGLTTLPLHQGSGYLMRGDDDLQDLANTAICKPSLVTCHGTPPASVPTMVSWVPV